MFEFLFQEENSQKIIKEGKSINLSLHYLEQVIISLRAAHIRQAAANTRSSIALAAPSKSISEAHTSFHIPYRNCILTSILRDSLGGNCKSCFLFTISMDVKQFEETISTCRYKAYFCL